MLDFGILLKRAGKVAADNSPAILTAIGVTGTLTTAYLAAKGAFKANDALREAQEEKLTNPEVQEDGELTTQEKFETTWKLYVPAAVSASLTVTAILCAARVNERRTAALASAYSVVEKSYAEYRAKTVEKAGKNKEQAIRDEIAQERVDKNPVSKTTLVVTTKGETLCYDMWSGRWFNSDLETIRKAVNDFNAKVIAETFASLTDFWEMIGLPQTSGSDDIGWNTDKLLDIDFSGVIDEHGQPAIAVDFKVIPDNRYSSMY